MEPWYKMCRPERKHSPDYANPWVLYSQQTVKGKGTANHMLRVSFDFVTTEKHISKLQVRK